MTPLRILVNRAITVENTAQRKAYPTRWDLERKFEEKSTYGNGNYKFVYKNEQCKWEIDIKLCYFSRDTNA